MKLFVTDISFLGFIIIFFAGYSKGKFLIPSYISLDWCNLQGETKNSSLPLSILESHPGFDLLSF